LHPEVEAVIRYDSSKVPYPLICALQRAARRRKVDLIRRECVLKGDVGV